MQDNTAAVIAAAVAAVAFALLSTVEFEGASALVVPLPQRSDLAPPEDWREPGEVLSVPGRHVHYWGRPLGQRNATSALKSGRIEYGRYASKTAKPFRAIVIHHTRDAPSKKYSHSEWGLRLVAYQHNGDAEKNYSKGYHGYVLKDGTAIQGAPASARTNHIKPWGNRLRKRGVAVGISSNNSIGLTAVGGCQPSRLFFRSCVGWHATKRQEETLAQWVRALQERYNIPCTAVYGHGELQSDRRSYEGAALAKRLRDEC